MVTLRSQCRGARVGGPSSGNWIPHATAEMGCSKINKCVAFFFFFKESDSPLTCLMALNKDTELCPQRSSAAGGARLGLSNPELHLLVVVLDSGQHLGRLCWEGEDSPSPRETVL